MSLQRSAEVDVAKVDVSKVGLLQREVEDRLVLQPAVSEGLALWLPFNAVDTLKDYAGGASASLGRARINISSCEDLTDWNGTNLALDGLDFTEGDYSIKETIISADPSSPYTITYNPSGQWNLKDNYFLFFDMKCNQPSSSFSLARVYLYDSHGFYRYWDLSFEGNVWSTFNLYLSYVNFYGRGGKDNSSGGSYTLVSSCEDTTNWSTNMPNASLYTYYSNKEGTYCVKALSNISNLNTNTDYYLRYTFSSPQDWSKHSFLYFFFGQCVPDSEYNYIRFYIYDTDGDWAYWDLGTNYARMRGYKIDLSSPTEEAVGGLNLASVAYIQWVVNRAVLSRSYQDFVVDWIRLDDLDTSSVEKIEWVFQSSSDMDFEIHLDNIRVDGTVATKSGKYREAVELYAQNYLYRPNQEPYVDGSDFTVTLWFKPDVSDLGWYSWLFFKRWGVALYPSAIYFNCYDQNGGHSKNISVTWSDKWYFVVMRCRKESSPDALDGKVELLLFDEDSLVCQDSITNFGSPAESNSYNWTLGCDYWACYQNDYFKGLLDDFRVYTRYLSDEEIESVKNDRRGSFGFKEEKVRSESLTISESLLKEFQRSYSETLSLSEEITRGITKLTTETVQLVDTLQEKFNAFRLETVTFLDSILKSSILSPFQEGIFLSDSLKKEYRASFSEAVSFQDQTQRKIKKFLLQTISFLESKILRLSHLLTETTAFTDVTIKGTGKELTETISLSDSLQRQVSFLRELLESISFIDTVTPVAALQEYLYETIVLTSLVRKKFITSKTETISFTSELTWSLKKALTETLQFIEIISFATTKIVLETLHVTDLLSKLTTRSYEEILMITDVLSLTFKKQLSETLTFTEVISRFARKLLFENITFLELTVREFSKFLIASVSFIDSLVKNIHVVKEESIQLISILFFLFKRQLVENISFLETVSKLFGRILSETVIFSEQIIFKTIKKVVESLTFLDSVSFLFATSLSEAVTLQDFVSLTARMILQELMSFSDTFSRQVSFFRTLTEDVTFLDFLYAVLGQTRILAESLILTDVLTRTVEFKRLYSESVSLVDSFTRIVGFRRTLAEGFTLAEELVVKVSKFLIESVTFFGELSRTVAFKRLFAETVSFIDSVSPILMRFLSQVLTETLHLSEAVIKTVQGIRQESILLISTIGKQIKLLRTEEVSFTDIVTPIWKQFYSIVLSETISIQDILRKTFARIVPETISLIDSITKLSKLTRQEILSLTGEVSKTLSRIVIETFTLSDVVRKLSNVIRTEAVTFVESLKRGFTALKTETISFIDTVTLKAEFRKLLVESVILADSLSYVETYMKMITSYVRTAWKKSHEVRTLIKPSYFVQTVIKSSYSVQTALKTYYYVKHLIKKLYRARQRR